MGPWDQIAYFVSATPEGFEARYGWDVLQVDGALQFAMWRDQVFAAWRAGQAPTWNSFVLLGNALLGNSQSGALYPPHVLAAYLPIGTFGAMAALAWFHLAVAGLGARAWVRELGASEAAATLAGTAWIMSSFLLQWTALPSVISTVAWLPWLLVGLHRRSLPLVGASGGLLLLAGHLQFAFLTLLGVMVYGLALLAVQRERRGSLLVCGLLGMVFAVVAAYPQLQPVSAFGELSPRRSAPTSQGYQAYIGTAIQPFEWANLASSNTLGNPREAINVDGQSNVTGYWPLFVKQGANAAESAITVGALTLGLLLLTPWRNRKTWPVAAIVLLGILLATGSPLNQLLYYSVPGWNATGSPGRAHFLVVLGLLVLAALGWDQAREAKRPLVYGAIGVTAAAPVLGFLLSFTAPSGEGFLLENLRNAAMLNLVPAVVVSVIAALVLFTRSQQADPRLAWGALAIPLLAWGTEGNFLVSSGRFPIEDRAVQRERVAWINGGWAIQARADTQMPPNLPYWMNQETISGYDSLVDRGTLEILREVNGGTDPAPPANGNMLFTKPEANPDKLGELGVSNVFGTGEVVGLPPTAATETLRRVVHRYDGFDLPNATAGRIQIPYRNLPGWTARLKGESLPISSTERLLTVNVPDGQTGTIEFRYLPELASRKWLPTGIVVGLFAVFLWDRKRYHQKEGYESDRPGED